MQKAEGVIMVRMRVPKSYDLSPERVAELQRFCWQYSEKKARIAALRGGANGTTIDGMPHGQGGVGRPTEQRAIDVVEGKDARDIAMIEGAAHEAADCDAMYDCLIHNVCHRVRFEYMATPSGRRQFYEMRRRFFWLLDKKR